MDPDAVKSTLSNLAFGNVVAAAARDLQKEMVAKEKAQTSSYAHEDVDLDELMDDPELEKLHAERITALKKEAEKRQEQKKKGHGEYRDVTEGEFLGEVTSSELVICYFYHHGFYRCKIMDKHLKTLAVKHVETKFKVDAENAPIFVNKLGIKTLPCVILFRCRSRSSSPRRRKSRSPTRRRKVRSPKPRRHRRRSRSSSVSASKKSPSPSVAATELRDAAKKQRKEEEEENKRIQHEIGLKLLEEETAKRIEEAIRKNVEEKLNSEEIKLEIERRTAEAQNKLFDDVTAQLKKEKEIALTEARQKEEQARREREELDKMLEENQRRVQESQKREALELKRELEVRQRELGLLQRQKEDGAWRKKQEEEEERANHILSGIK